jgi:predicted nucleic acid-binding protein
LQGLIDTSVVVDLELVSTSNLPAQVAVSAITMAELAAGPHATADAEERLAVKIACNERKQPLIRLPFDGDAARAYGRVYAAVVGAGRKARGARAIDLLIAAAALAANVPLYTRNREDFRGLENLIDIVAI